MKPFKRENNKAGEVYNNNRVKLARKVHQFPHTRAAGHCCEESKAGGGQLNKLLERGPEGGKCPAQSLSEELMDREDSL